MSQLDRTGVAPKLAYIQKDRADYLAGRMAVIFVAGRYTSPRFFITPPARREFRPRCTRLWAPQVMRIRGNTHTYL